MTVGLSNVLGRGGKMEFIVLSIITLISFIYCCDYPAIEGFEFLINNKQSIFYGVGLSIIAAYIFYIIQVFIPHKQLEKQAYNTLEKKIKSYLDKVYWVLVFCESLCDIDRTNKKITIKSVFARWSKNGDKSNWIVKIDVSRYEKGIEKSIDEIVGSGYYMQLESKKRIALQRLIDNKFVTRFNKNISLSNNVTDLDLIELYEDFKNAVIDARKCFKISDILILNEYTDEKVIEEFEFTICNNEKANEGLNGIWFYKIKS